MTSSVLAQHLLRSVCVTPAYKTFGDSYEEGTKRFYAN